MSNLEQANWVYKSVKDSNQESTNVEMIINFYDDNKTEININQFTSRFNVDFDTFFDKKANDENDYNKELGSGDEVEANDDNYKAFESRYHHSLLLGKYELKDNNDISIVIEKVFTNEKDIFTLENQEIELTLEPKQIVMDKNCIIPRMLNHPTNIYFQQINQTK